MLQSSKEIEVRFSEVDSMGVVWHGSYPLYFEDAREAFGEQWGLTYKGFVDNNVYAPLVELTFHYKAPIRHGQHITVTITYKPTDSAKIVFDYEIHDTETRQLLTTGHTVQVFMNLQYELLWEKPEFYRLWQEKNLEK